MEASLEVALNPATSASLADDTGVFTKNISSSVRLGTGERSSPCSGTSRASLAYSLRITRNPSRVIA